MTIRSLVQFPQDGVRGVAALGEEYRAMYRCFVQLVRSGQNDVDLAPLQIVANAFLKGRMIATEPFEF